MKKHLVCVVCVLLFGCGLFALHLVAQSAKTEVSVKLEIPLLDPKIEECNERELLELKIKSYQKALEFRNNASVAGIPAGSARFVAEACADLAAAEADLYRSTGERDKLLTALKAQVDALRGKLEIETYSYEGGAASVTDVCATEIQLLDALLEQKRTRESKQ